MKRSQFKLLGFAVLILVVGGCSQFSSSTISTVVQLNGCQDESFAVIDTDNTTIALDQEQLEVAEPNYCLECHVDKQQLIDTAKPEEEEISESSGEG